MKTINGQFYNGIDSKAHSAKLAIYENTITLESNSLKSITLPTNALKFSDRIGNTPRFVIFPDNSKFETQDNDAIDAIASSIKYNKTSGILHLLEAKKRFVLASLILLIAFTTWAGVYGIPIVSKKIAYAMPKEFQNLLGSEVISSMDNAVFTPSEIPEEKQTTIRDLFEKYFTSHSQFSYQIHFRKSKYIGANAFAIPSGDIIITDGLIELIENDYEILSILAHEVAHVEKRHGLQSLIQDSLVAVLVLSITGDLFSTTAFAASIPIFLTESHYSRVFENEADDYALEFLRANNIDPNHFANIIGRISPDKSKTNAFDYLSSHPVTTERMQKFRN